MAKSSSFVKNILKHSTTNTLDNSCTQKIGTFQINLKQSRTEKTRQNWGTNSKVQFSKEDTLRENNSLTRPIGAEQFVRD
jgi:hypothetical protein